MLPRPLLFGALILAACNNYPALSRCYLPRTAPSSRPANGFVTGPPFWTSVAQLPTAEQSLGLASNAGGLISFGGSSASGTLATSQLLGFGASAWSAGPVMSGPRQSLAAAADRTGMIYAIGGFDGANELPTAEALAPDGGAWSSLPPMSAPRQNLAAYVDACGEVLAGGGTRNGQDLGTVEAYVPQSQKWVSLPGLIFPRSSLGLASVEDGTTYAVGGSLAGTPTADAEVFDMRTNRWSAVPQLQVPRTGLGVVAAPDGRVYAIGGNDGISPIVATVEAYWPGDPGWTSVAPLPVNTAYLAATRGWDGRIYVAGGSNGNAINNVEAYGPQLTLSTGSGPAGTSVLVTGSNFAAGATVHIYWGDIHGPLLGTGSTGASGQLASPIMVTIPAAAAGAYTITAVDDLSAYPVRAAFTLGP